jgi:hypothetical protein
VGLGGAGFAFRESGDTRAPPAAITCHQRDERPTAPRSRSPSPGAPPRTAERACLERKGAEALRRLLWSKRDRKTSSWIANCHHHSTLSAQCRSDRPTPSKGAEERGLAGRPCHNGFGEKVNRSSAPQGEPAEGRLRRGQVSAPETRVRFHCEPGGRSTANLPPRVSRQRGTHTYSTLLASFSVAPGRGVHLRAWGEGSQSCRATSTTQHNMSSKTSTWS